MGLDAVVYKNRNNLLLDDVKTALIDGQTGEVYFEDPGVAAKYREQSFVAVHRRLGNVANIDSVRSEIPSEVADELPVLLGKVLYSGSHSGDVIDIGLLNSLEDQVELLSKSTSDIGSPALATFLGNMRDLIRVARSEQNPIVFV